MENMENGDDNIMFTKQTDLKLPAFNQRMNISLRYGWQAKAKDIISSTGDDVTMFNNQKLATKR